MSAWPSVELRDLDEQPEHLGFLLVPQFAMMAFFSAVEPLRVANRLSGRTLYRWSAFSADGEPVEASNGMRLMAEGRLDEARGLSLLFVCAGFEPQQAETPALLASLRRLARSGTILGALDTGAHILAKARLIHQAPVTMHWEAVNGFREDFPEIEVSDELFEIGTGLITCAGGTAALDLMLDLISKRHGPALAVAVSEQFIHDRIRDRRDHQRMTLAKRLGITNSRVLKIVALMETNLERPLDNGELASHCGVSPRQLERLFRQHLGHTPSHYYLNLRLERARQLLRQTDMSVLDVALASGFSSASCLTRSYRSRYSRPPREDRREPSAVPRPAG